MKTMCSKPLRALVGAYYGFKHPSWIKTAFQQTLRSHYAEGKREQHNLPKIDFDALEEEIALANFASREGNVTLQELTVIAKLIAAYKPKNLLEIGTFDGNTTLQMALNAPKDALIHTIDLPNEPIATEHTIDQVDLKFVQDSQKHQRKYQKSGVASKVTQHFGDSTTYDFSQFGEIDFCFIDGGHSYDCVRKDTEKVLKILAPKAVVLWHDFDPNWNGVYNWLLEFSKQAEVKHIEGTALACWIKK